MLFAIAACKGFFAATQHFVRSLSASAVRAVNGAPRQTINQPGLEAGGG